MSYYPYAAILYPRIHLQCWGILSVHAKELDRALNDAVRTVSDCLRSTHVNLLYNMYIIFSHRPIRTPERCGPDSTQHGSGKWRLPPSLDHHQKHITWTQHANTRHAPYRPTYRRILNQDALERSECVSNSIQIGKIHTKSWASKMPQKVQTYLAYTEAINHRFITIESLSPSNDVLVQHAKRTVYQGNYIIIMRKNIYCQSIDTKTK